MLKSLICSVAAGALLAGAAVAQTAPTAAQPQPTTPPTTGGMQTPNTAPRTPTPQTPSSTPATSTTPQSGATQAGTTQPGTPQSTTARGAAAQPGMPQTGTTAGGMTSAGQPFATTEQTGTIFAAIQGNPQFSTLVAALEQTNLDDVLTRTSRAEGYTLFAPTNAAFERVPAAQREALMNDPQALQALLLHHVVGTRVTAAQLRNERDGNRPLPMADNSTQPISGSGDTVTLGGATVVQADITAANGNIHVVDGVIMAAGAGSAAAAAAAGSTPAGAPASTAPATPGGTTSGVTPPTSPSGATPPATPSRPATAAPSATPSGGR